MKLIEGQLIHRRYRLDSRLAQGGMGEVWKGYDIQLGRPVAIKALRQLGLVQARSLPDGARRWAPVPAARKQDLASAPILRQLEE